MVQNALGNTNNDNISNKTAFVSQENNTGEHHSSQNGDNLMGLEVVVD